MNRVMVPTTIYTIATGSRLGGHVTSVHIYEDELIKEVNSTLECDENMISHIIEEYNETANTLDRPLYTGNIQDFDFAFIAKNDPQLDNGGWGWAFDYINANGNEDHSYLNISVHKWHKNYFMTEG